VSQPTTVGGRFVAYFEREGLLSIAAVDATTGEVAWELPASVSGLTGGVALHVESDGRLVYFGTPVDPVRLDPSVFVVAVEAATGAEVWRTTTPLILADSLYACEDDRDSLCVSDERPGPDRALRIAKATGEVTSRAAGAEPPAIGRALGSGLYDLGGRDPEVIAAIDASGRTLWTRTAGELFRGRPVSSDHGWNWDRYGDVFVGSLGWIDLDEGVTDLSRASIAGVDAATGAVRWVDDGAELGCGVGGTQPIRCRLTGTATQDPDVIGDLPVVTGLRVVMERFDPATGTTQWQADLGPAISLILDTAPLVRLSPTELAVGREDGTSVAVDITSGATRLPADDEVGWCVSENSYRDRRTVPDPHRRLGQEYLTQCRVDGSTVTVLASWPIEMGARVRQIFAWVDASGMHGATTDWVRW